MPMLTIYGAQIKKTDPVWVLFKADSDFAKHVYEQEDCEEC